MRPSHAQNHADVTAPIRLTCARVGVADGAATALLFAGQFFILAGGPPGPAVDAPAAEIQRLFQTRDRPSSPPAPASHRLGLLTLRWWRCRPLRPGPSGTTCDRQPPDRTYG
jgi:hypothetical protein